MSSEAGLPDLDSCMTYYMSSVRSEKMIQAIQLGLGLWLPASTSHQHRQKLLGLMFTSLMAPFFFFYCGKYWYIWLLNDMLFVCCLVLDR